MNTIQFDRAKLSKLKQAYEGAEALALDQFTFDGQEFVTSYAKYLIEYLEGQLK